MKCAKVKFFFRFNSENVVGIDFISDNYPRSGYHYSGFPLNNFEAVNFYEELSLDECQYLCQITDQCLFFNYSNQSRICYLKHGMGEKKKSTGLVGDYFGNKYSSGTFHVIQKLE